MSLTFPLKKHMDWDSLLTTGFVAGSCWMLGQAVKKWRECSTSSISSVEFGEACRALFYLDFKQVFLNHASFGTVPKVILHNQFAAQEHCEEHPDRWYRNEALDLWKKSCDAVAKSLGLDEVSLVNNASTAVNAVLKSQDLPKEAGVLYFDTTYGAVQYTVKYLGETRGWRPVCVPLKEHLPLPQGNETAWLINHLRRAIEADRKENEGDSRLQFAVLDHITSPTALVLPIKELIAVCHEYGIEVLVDGAHAPGQVELDPEGMDAEYYTGNLHKWAFCPKGSAILWAKAGKWRDSLQSNVLSWFWKSTYQQRFYWQGTQDLSAHVTCAKSMEFVENILGGWKRIYEYNHKLVMTEATRMAEKFKTETLAPESMVAFMACVRLPLEDVYDPSDPTTGEDPMNDLFKYYDIQSATFLLNGRYWARLSAQVYSTASDFEKFSDAVLDLKKRRLPGGDLEGTRVVPAVDYQGTKQQNKE